MKKVQRFYPLKFALSIHKIIKPFSSIPVFQRIIKCWIVFVLVFIVGCAEDEAPSNEPWQPISSPPAQFRTHHSFGFSFNGKGYLVTGDSGIPRRDFYEYDPIADQWMRLDDYPGPPRSYGIGTIFNNKAYLGFGYDENYNYLNDLWVFDPNTMTWSELANCPCVPRLHPALVAHNGKLYMGMGNNPDDLKDWWEYDIEKNKWVQKSDFPDSERHHPYQFSIGNYVYTGLGHGEEIYKTWFRYNPTLDEWTQMSDLPGEGRVAGSQFSFNGMGYIISGDGEDHIAMDTGEFWRYNPDDDTWEQLPSHPGQSRWAPATFIIDNEVYVVNGAVTQHHGLNFQGTAYKYKLE